MGVDAIDQTICPSVLGMTKCSIAFGICPSVLGMTKCSIAFGHLPHAIEHLVIPSTSGQIVWSIASTPIK